MTVINTKGCRHSQAELSRGQSARRCALLPRRPALRVDDAAIRDVDARLGDGRHFGERVLVVFLGGARHDQQRAVAEHVLPARVVDLVGERVRLGPQQEPPLGAAADARDDGVRAERRFVVRVVAHVPCAVGVLVAQAHVKVAFLETQPRLHLALERENRPARSVRVPGYRRARRAGVRIHLRPIERGLARLEDGLAVQRDAAPRPRAVERRGQERVRGGGGHEARHVLDEAAARQRQPANGRAPQRRRASARARRRLVAPGPRHVGGETARAAR